MNATMIKFGAPDSIVQEFSHWAVLLRPKQATLGALVLIATDPAKALSALPQPAFTELKTVVAAIEAALGAAFAYNKINYLMLMMVDPDVHFHILPRYADDRQFGGCAFTDPGWPGPPDLGWANPLDAACAASLRDHIAKHITAL